MDSEGEPSKRKNPKYDKGDARDIGKHAENDQTGFNLGQGEPGTNYDNATITEDPTKALAETENAEKREAEDGEEHDDLDG